MQIKENKDIIKENTFNTIIKSIRQMTPIEFFNFYLKNYQNQFSEFFQDLDFTNSIAMKHSEKNFSKKNITQIDLLNKYREGIRINSKKGLKPPYLIYAYYNKKTGFFRIGRTQTSPETRIKNYKINSNYKIGNNYILTGDNYQWYDDMRSVNDKDLKIILLDLHYDADSAQKSEEFWTIYFNRDNNALLGFDLSHNKKYNPIVGDLFSFRATYHHIDYYELKTVIEFGYERYDAATIFGVSLGTLDSRIRDYWGEEWNYKDFQLVLIKPILEKYISEGLTSGEIAQRFIKFNIKNKELMMKTYLQRSNLKLIDGLEIESFSSHTIRRWTREIWGRSFSEVQEKLYIRPIIISLLKEGKSIEEALIELNRNFVSNPNRIGISYDKQSLRSFIYRFWGKSWNEMRDIFIEPIIENLIRNGLKIKDIAIFFGRSIGYITNYLKRNWDFNGLEEARKFFNINYLGYHEYDYFVN